MKPRTNETSTSTVLMERNPSVITRIAKARLWGPMALVLALVPSVLALLPSGLMAQGGPGGAQALASQNLTGYTHMFIAYFVCWIIVLGWTISIARRLGRVEQALKE